MSEESKRKFADLNMTKEEMDRFSEAMKKEEFRKLLVEYAEELADPTNRAQYEKEIAMLEEERGMNVTFIHPEKGFCLKTTQNGDLKCFINICKNENIAKPSSKSQVSYQDSKPKPGLFWEIPHSCSPAREDMDHEKKKCIVYDVVFHPDSYRMGETNARFKKLLTDSAMDTIEHSYKVKLDRPNAKILQKLDFKGRQTACVIKKKMDTSDDDNKKNSNEDPIKPLIDQIRQHELDKQLEEKLKKPVIQIPVTIPEPSSQPPTHTTPKYSILHRGMPDMSDHAIQYDSSHITSTRPKEIVVSIELPLLKSSQNCTLDVFETTLELLHEDPNYKLSIKLPYPVREVEARARFDKSKRTLNITLPVIPYVGKLEPSTCDYSFPLSSDSSSSTSCSSISEESSPPAEPVKTDLIRSDIKYKLPSKVAISESASYLTLRFGVNNFVKDSIRIRIEDDSSISMTCESCSLSGCYITYYSVFIHLDSSRIDSDLVTDKVRLISDFDELQTASVNFIDNDLFELKLRKLTNKATSGTTQSLAQVSLVKGDTDSRTQVNIQQELTDEKAEQTLISASKVNNMTRKDYIINFKDIIAEKPESLDEDDDLEEPVKKPKKKNSKITNSKSTISNEKLKFEQRKSATDINKPEATISELATSCSDIETEYLQDQINTQYEDDMNEENDEADKEAERSSSANSNSNEGSVLGSSLNSNSSSTHLKGILKKPRSVSESEGSHTCFSRDFKNMSLKQQALGCSLGDESSENIQSTSEDNLQGSKKSVHFNNQVVRNMFKSNSTIQGMKKPNSQKNKKKNQRKRTVSDPSHDFSKLTDNDSKCFRSRSISESTDDGNGNTSQSANSGDSVNEEECLKSDQTQSENSAKKKKKKNNKKKNNSKNSAPAAEAQSGKKQPGADLNNNGDDEPNSNKFNVETMLQWKNQGLLPDDSQLKHGTECAFKFKNKLIEDLDD